MNQYLLQVNGLSLDLLESLSFESKLGLPLKKNLHYFAKESLINELVSYADWLDENELLGDIPLDYRIKSSESIKSKYERYYPDYQARKVFNDILGFRAFCDNYTDVLRFDSEQFHIANMSQGKAADDGYRGVHVYFQKSGRHYPIEIQFNTYYDRQLNDWLHDYLYKKQYPAEVGKKMRNAYEAGKIQSKYEFEEVLKNVLFGCEG